MRGEGKQSRFATAVAERRENLRRRAGAGDERAHQAAFALYETHPDYSARVTMTRMQLAWLVALLSLTGAAFLLDPEWTLAVLTLAFTLFYLSVTFFRAAILARWQGRLKMPASVDLALSGTHRHGNECDETYCILAALHREAEQVAPLVAALDGLIWRHGVKRVFLICEAGDRETIEAIISHGLPSDFDLVVVPEGSPQTKPRALNYCLAGCEGDYLVIYDAEDRPHSLQLEEARQTFARAGGRLACLQAPLQIDNERAGWLARLFSIEYDTLFHGILPALARWRAPMPLGGTSNHFRLDLLKKVACGWDPFNVTEDADLGIRLARLGLECGVIASPTFEEAPARTGSWIRQRTRWIKGWMQTLLVHLRNPLKTASDLGWWRFALLHMVLTAVVVSVLVHPLFLAGFVVQITYLATGTQTGVLTRLMLAASTFNLVAGYTVYGFLAWAVRTPPDGGGGRRWIALLPLYWLLISVAGWRALWQLVHDPHHWEKTDHPAALRDTPALARSSPGDLSGNASKA